MNLGSEIYSLPVVDTTDTIIVHAYMQRRLASISDISLKISEDCLPERESWKIRSNHAPNFKGKGKVNQDKTLELYSDKLAKRCGSESCSFIYAHGQLSSNLLLNFYEIWIATIRGKTWEIAESKTQNKVQTKVTTTEKSILERNCWTREKKQAREFQQRTDAPCIR